jgi:ribonuclease P protein component
LRSEGRTLGHAVLALRALERGCEVTRCAFVVSRRVGPAVVRNRVKRRLREATRALLPRLRVGWDLSISARPAAARATWDELRRAVEETIRRAGLLV